MTAMTTVSGTRGRLRTIDPLTIAASAVALVVYLLHGFNGGLTRDLGVYSYAGQQVAEGIPPYGGILNRAGPLAHLIPGIGAFVARTIGADDVLGMRVLLMLISVACIGVAYHLSRDIFGSRLAGLATAAAMLSFQGFIEYATYGPREKTAMVLFLLCALLATVHQRWGTTGFFIALATLTWQPVFLAAMTGAVAAVLLGVRSGTLKALLRLGVGGLIPTAITVGSYVAIGQLQLFLDDFLLINARYTDQGSMLLHPPEVWQLMVGAYGWSIWVFLVGFVSVLALSVRALASRTTRREPANAALVGSGVLLVTGTLWSLKAFDGWPDAFFMLPASALGIGGLTVLVGRRIPGRGAVALTVAWAVAATAMSVSYSIGSRDDTLIEQRADVEAVLAALPAKARILSVEAPEPLVLAHQRNYSRLQLFGNGLIDYVDETWPGGSPGYGQWVVDREAALIAYGGRLPLPKWLGPAMSGSYVRVGSSPGWGWYARRTLGRESLDKLRAVLHDRA